MNASCPQCKTVFRVDPRKVPPEGVRARCSVCGGVFEVIGEERYAAPAPAVAAGTPHLGMEAPAPSRAAGPVESAVVTPPPTPAPEIEPAPEPEPPLPTAETPAPAPAPAPAAEVPEPPGIRFGQTDPETRARRLARALVSDVAAYHPERQEIGLREGRLKELFQEELKKSWQEYVDKVGLDVAKSTPYFRDALNEILAKGKRVF